MVNMVVAMSQNRVIGSDNKLIWNLPPDLKRFKSLTKGGVVVMGRKTHLSIGRVLPDRLNVILSRDKKWYNPLGDNCVVCYSIEEVMEKFKHREIFVIGGGEIYNQFLPHTNRIYQTVLKKNYDGDTIFPVLSSDWKIVDSVSNSYLDIDFDYLTLEK